MVLQSINDNDNSWIEIKEKSEKIMDKNKEAYTMLAMDETVKKE